MNSNVHYLLWFVALFTSLILSAVALDGLLHYLNMAWVGRYLGIIGTVTLLISFLYSARKRKLVSRGNMPSWLRSHEYLAWCGTMMILVHGGIHFNAWLPWYALIAMVIAAASGLIGKLLMRRSQDLLTEKTKDLRQIGLSDTEIRERIYWDALTFSLMRRWRSVHIPVTLMFAILSIYHIIAILIFWSWR
ncbi:hypothetical protein L6Q79_02660 [bacterium]|nr:hypothetical protein [bacterium]NUN44728.1 hypothetical protein [bacterium]